MQDSSCAEGPLAFDPRRLAKYYAYLAIVHTLLALGARGVLLGRAWAYALAGAGQEGVGHVLALVAAELRVAMALTACTNVREIGAEIPRG